MKLIVKIAKRNTHGKLNASLRLGIRKMYSILEIAREIEHGVVNTSSQLNSIESILIFKNKGQLLKGDSNPLPRLALCGLLRSRSELGFLPPPTPKSIRATTIEA